MIAQYSSDDDRGNRGARAGNLGVSWLECRPAPCIMRISVPRCRRGVVVTSRMVHPLHRRIGEGPVERVPVIVMLVVR